MIRIQQKLVETTELYPVPQQDDIIEVKEEELNLSQLVDSIYPNMKLRKLKTPSQSIIYYRILLEIFPFAIYLVLLRQIQTNWSFSGYYGFFLVLIYFVYLIIAPRLVPTSENSPGNNRNHETILHSPTVLIHMFMTLGQLGVISLFHQNWGNGFFLLVIYSFLVLGQVRSADETIAELPRIQLKRGDNREITFRLAQVSYHGIQLVRRGQPQLIVTAGFLLETEEMGIRPLLFDYLSFYYDQTSNFEQSWYMKYRVKYYVLPVIISLVISILAYYMQTSEPSMFTSVLISLISTVVLLYLINKRLMSRYLTYCSNWISENQERDGYTKFVELTVDLIDETSTFFSDAPKLYLDYLGISHLPEVFYLVKNSIKE